MSGTNGANLLTKNLQNQSQNFGRELLIKNQNGANGFYDANTGANAAGTVDASSYVLQSGPLDNSFQLDPNQYAVSVAMFQSHGVSDNLSNTFGAIAAATAKQLGVAPGNVYSNGVMSNAMLDNVNSFNSVNSQIGYNAGSSAPPYFNNLLLGAKIVNQTQ